MKSSRSVDMLDREYSEVKLVDSVPFVLVSMSSDEPFAIIPTIERNHKSIFRKFYKVKSSKQERRNIQHLLQHDILSTVSDFS